jgi:hypothetical protein
VTTVCFGFWREARSELDFFRAALRKRCRSRRGFSVAPRETLERTAIFLSPETSGSRSPLRHLRARDSRRGTLPTARRTRARSSTRG